MSFTVLLADWFGSLRRQNGRLYRRLLWWYNYKRILASECSVAAAVDSDDINAALKLLAYQQYKYQWHFQVERFVFKPACRPADPYKAYELLLGIHESKFLLPHQCFYAGISAIYMSVRLSGLVDSFGLRQWLIRQADLTSSEQIVFSPQWRNRECPYKQVISARACLLQLVLIEGRASVEIIEAIGQANLRILNELTFREVSADVLYRSTTNLLRGLLCLSFNRLGCYELLNSLGRLRKELESGRYQRSAQEAKENHIGLLIEVIELLNLAMTSESHALRKKRLFIMINMATPCMIKGSLDWLDFIVSNSLSDS